MRLATLQKLTGRQNQFTPFDPPRFEQATVGGTVAANLNGPRRLFYGSLRDLVIGMKVALPSGDEIKAGGKVVKNVAGYDMCKLFVGSLGTLGIVTEVTLRLAPVAERAATLTASGGTLAHALRLCGEIWRSRLLPAAVVILNNRATTRVGGHEWAVAVWIEGFAESVTRHLRDLGEMARRNDLSTETLESESHDRFWSQLCDFPLRPDRLAYRLTRPRASLRQLESLWQTCQVFGEAPALLADANAGTVWLSFSVESSAVAGFAEISSLARDCAGHAVLFAAPGELGKSTPTELFEPHRKRIAALALWTDLIVFAFPPGCGGGHYVPITIDEYRPFTWAGRHEPEAFEPYQESCGADAVEELRASWIIDVLDPQWGRPRYLWDHLHQVVVEKIQSPFDVAPADESLGTDFVW